MTSIKPARHSRGSDFGPAPERFGEEGRHPLEITDEDVERVLSALPELFEDGEDPRPAPRRSSLRPERVTGRPSAYRRESRPVVVANDRGPRRSEPSAVATLDHIALAIEEELRAARAAAPSWEARSATAIAAPPPAPAPRPHARPALILGAAIVTAAITSAVVSRLLITAPPAPPAAQPVAAVATAPAAPILVAPAAAPIPSPALTQQPAAQQSAAPAPEPVKHAAPAGEARPRPRPPRAPIAAAPSSPATTAPTLTEAPRPNPLSGPVFEEE